MEVCVPPSKSPHLDCYSNCGSGSLKIPLKTTQNPRADLSVSDLETCLTEILVRDGIDVKESENHDVSQTELGNEINGKDLHKNKSAHSASENFLGKCCSTCPPKQESSSIIRDFKEKQKEISTKAGFEANLLANSANDNQSCLQSESLPTPSKPLSALKGSREKQGIPPKKLSVTWAPDVYDPIPTSASHVPSPKNHHYRHYGKRKNNQHKRTVKSSRSSSKDSREKKQTRKSVGTSSSSSKLKPTLDYDRGIGVFAEPIGSENAICGSSSLLPKNSVHFSPAEAI